jgi:integrase
MGELRLRYRTWQMRYYVNGRKVERSTGKKTKTEAKAVLAKIEAAIADHNYVDPKAGKIRFDEAVAEVVNDYRVNGKRSLSDVERRIKLHLLPAFTGRMMANLNTTHVRAYIATRQTAGAANAQINRELAIVKRAFRLAMQAGILRYQPYIPMLDESRNVRTGFLEPDQYAALLKALPAFLRPVVTFAYVTGWRIKSEVLSLTWGQVDRAQQVIRLDASQSKNKKPRQIDYGDNAALAKLIAAQWKERQALSRKGTVTAHVFHRNGRPIKDFRKTWDLACEAAGIHGRIPHDMRRTAVRNLSRAGVPDKIAMAITGHKTRSVFDRYNIVSTGDVKEALGKLTPSKGDSESGIVRQFRRKR